LQSSFLVHFNLFGAVPNLVFILFFLTIFFTKERINYTTIIYAVVAGLFLDIFSYTPLGLSIVLLLIISYLEKNIQNYLKEGKDNYPLTYFLPIFLIFFVLYNILVMIFLRFIDSSRIAINFGPSFLGAIIYNLFFATIGFWVFKKLIAYVKKIQS
jgi:rod shape-determining protein MreD